MVRKKGLMVFCFFIVGLISYVCVDSFFAYGDDSPVGPACHRYVGIDRFEVYDGESGPQVDWSEVDSNLFLKVWINQIPYKEPPDFWIPVPYNLRVDVYNNGIVNYSGDDVQVRLGEYTAGSKELHFDWDVGPDAGVRTICLNLQDIDAGPNDDECLEFEIMESVIPVVQGFIVQRNGINVNYGVLEDNLRVIVGFDEIPASWGTNPPSIKVYNDDVLYYGDSVVVESVDVSGGVVVLKWNVGTKAGEREIVINGVGSGSIPIVFNIKSLLNDFFDSIEKISVYVGNYESGVRVYNFDLNGTALQYYNYTKDLNLEGYGVTVKIDFDNFLDGFTYDLEAREGDTYPAYNKFNINPDSTAANVIGGLLVYYDYDGVTKDLITVNMINNNPNFYLNKLIDDFGGEYVGYQSPIHARIIKSGGDYYFYDYSQGYFDVKDRGYKEAIKQIIKDKIKEINPQEVVDFAVPYFDLSDYVGFVGNYGLTVDLDELDELNQGVYDTKISYRDEHGNEGEKVIELILDIPAMESGNPVSGVYTFTNPVIMNSLNRITELNDSWGVDVEFYGSEAPRGWNISLDGGVDEVFDYFDVNIPDVIIGGDYWIYFKLSLLELNIYSLNPNEVVLYVADTNGVWGKLDTEVVDSTGDPVLFRARTSSFPKFMIGAKVSTQTGTPNPTSKETKSSGRGGRSTTGGNVLSEGLITTEGEEGEQGSEENLIVLENQQGQQEGEQEGGLGSITGAVVAGGEGIGDVFMNIIWVLIVILVIIIIIFLIKKRKKAKQKTSM